MSSTAQVPRAEVLNSWKEIAAHLGRGVRTVQRWERQLGLPVHRPYGRDRSAVLAFPAELDQWLHETPIRNLGLHPDGREDDSAVVIPFDEPGAPQPRQRVKRANTGK